MKAQHIASLTSRKKDVSTLYIATLQQNLKSTVKILGILLDTYLKNRVAIQLTQTLMLLMPDLPKGPHFLKLTCEANFDQTRKYKADGSLPYCPIVDITDLDTHLQH